MLARDLYYPEDSCLVPSDVTYNKVSFDFEDGNWTLCQASFEH